MLDFLVVPIVFGCAGLALVAATRAEIPSLLASSLIVAGAAAIIRVLEHVHPERAESTALDRPLLHDGAHFLFNYQLGYVLATAACLPIPRGTAWPEHWPFALQVLLAFVVGEGLSYWQHRLYHRFSGAWRFHALHHSGSRLNLFRAGRFHFADVGVGAFATFAPLKLAGTPDAIMLWYIGISGVAGVLQHCNVRIRTPRWLDALICTPAVHRTHHSIDLAESNTNFGTTVMLFDWLFGSYALPAASTPAAVGLRDDREPRTFWASVIAPFSALRER